MRPFSFCLSLCLLLDLSGAAVAGEPPDGSAGRVISPACNAGTPDPGASANAGNEPPAWLLLASAVALLGAGRLAGRP